MEDAELQEGWVLMVAGLEERLKVEQLKVEVDPHQWSPTEGVVVELINFIFR